MTGGSGEVIAGAGICDGLHQKLALHLENNANWDVYDNITEAYTGGTTIDSGASLYVGYGGTDGNMLGNIVDNGSLWFFPATTVTYSGVISGTGSVYVYGVLGRRLCEGFGVSTDTPRRWPSTASLRQGPYGPSWSFSWKQIPNASRQSFCRVVKVPRLSNAATVIVGRRAAWPIIVPQFGRLRLIVGRWTRRGMIAPRFFDRQLQLAAWLVSARTTVKASSSLLMPPSVTSVWSRSSWPKLSDGSVKRYFTPRSETLVFSRRKSVQPWAVHQIGKPRVGYPIIFEGE